MTHDEFRRQETLEDEEMLKVELPVSLSSELMSRTFGQDGPGELGTTRHLDYLKSTHIKLHSEFSDSEDEIDIHSAYNVRSIKTESPFENLISQAKSRGSSPGRFDR